MNEEHSHQPQTDSGDPARERFIIIRLRRRTLAEWFAWMIWLLALILILEYALMSFKEHERQAGILSAAIFLALLVAGIIIEVVKGIEVRSPYYGFDTNDDDIDVTG